MNSILSMTAQHDVIVILIFAGQVVLIEFDVLVAVESNLGVVISIEVNR